MPERPTVTLDEIASEVRYGYTASATDAPTGVKLLRTTDVVRLPLDWSSVPFCEIDQKDLAKYQLADNDIVIARMGTIGVSALVRPLGTVVFASNLIRFRQNYVEDGIGRFKADALAARLRAIRDDLTVTVAEGLLPDDPSDFVAADLIIDATVSNSITQCLDEFAALPERKALIAQVATDAKSGTLGILNLCAPNLQLGPSEIDHNAGRTITSDGELELYHGLWRESPDDHELIPTRGCSVPTFHGSAADLAAVAATLVSLLGNHLRQTPTALSGTHLIALPHADSGPRHYFLSV